MEQSPFGEVNRLSATQEISRILWNPKVHYRIHMNLPPMYVIPNMLNFLRWGVVSTSPNHQDGVPPRVGRSRPLIQYIRSYLPYLQAVPQSATWERAMPW